MARTSVLIPTSVWQCPDFRGMDEHAQHLFLMLYTHPDRSQAGGLNFTPNRWAGLSSDSTEAEIRKSLEGVQAAGYAAIDHNSDEIVVRLLVPIAGHKRLQGALADAAKIESRPLRMFAVERLQELTNVWRANAGASVRTARMAEMRMRVHTRDGFCCLHCGWAPPLPGDYDGRYALGDLTLDPATGLYESRLLELDHVHPRSLGGKFTFDNLQTLCNTCNLAKGARF